MKVYQAITAVQMALSKEGISKSRNNAQQGYKFRGIDDVYNALSPMLAANQLCILPRCLSRTVVERTTQKGGVLFYVCIEAEFDFVSAEDGSKHTVKTFGEAMDSGDKATNKAMSAAYKYAAFQAFAIPTEGDNDADAQTHVVKPSLVPAPITPTTGAFDGLAPDRAEVARRIGDATIELFESGALDDAYQYLYVENKDAGKIDNDEFLAVWSMLGPYSKQRGAIKKMREERAKAKAA